MSLLYFLVSALLLVGCAPKTPPDNSCKLNSVNFIDRNGISETITNPERLKKFETIDFCSPQAYQKVLRVYGSDPQGNTPAFITSYHPNGQLKQYLETVNNRASGSYCEYYVDGQIKVEAVVIGGTADLTPAAENSWLYDGVSKAWDQKGNLIAEIQYCKGDLEGISTYYHPNGCVWKKVPFFKNRLSGTLEIYLEDGSLFQTTEYLNGNKTGASLRFWNNKVIATSEQYQNGLLVSGSYYDQNGKLLSEVVDGEGCRLLFGKESVVESQEFHNGALNGAVKCYDKNGKLTRSYHKINDLKHGESVEYWEKKTLSPQPLPRLSIMFYEGKIQGLTRTWYDNGVQESQREMSNNSKHGLATAWYRDGSLMLIEEYDHNKLVRGEYYKKGEKAPVSQVIQSNGTVTLFDGEGHFIRKVPYLNGRPDE